MKVSRTASVMCFKSGVPRQDPTIVVEGYHNERHSDTEESSIKF